MRSDSSTTGLHPPANALASIQALYDAGLNLQAYQASREFGPLAQWRGTAARILAGRIAANVGGHRLGQVLHWLAWRSDKTDPDVAAYHANSLLQRRGPVAAHEFFERLGNPDPNAPPDGLMHFYSSRAMVAGALRDFVSAAKYIEEAARHGPNHPWQATSRAHLFELEDKYEEALAAARRALELRPWYRPGVQAVAHALQILDRDEEALALLTEAMRRIENTHVARQLAILQDELQLYEDEAATLDRIPVLMPLMEKADRNWLEKQRIGLACSRRDFATALAGARQIAEPIYRDLAQRLQTGAEYRRLRLEVPFVRQHHLTCAPATLSAISRFWQKPAEHLDLAEEICYDGTPAHSERHWAESNGWAVREFKVTWSAAVALLDRGIPFTLTTAETTSGHLQAVVGYDELRETLWIRDPFIYSTHEFSIKPLLERYRATGPRGMAMVPVEKSGLLDGLELPEAGLHDQLHAVNHALSRHRRGDAVEVCRRMEAESPGHRLTLSARRSMAAYDANAPALLECLNELLAHYPGNGNLNLAKLSCLRELSGRAERIQLLEELCARPGCDPIFWQQYAQELRADAGQHRAAASWVRWGMRLRPNDPAFVISWADLLWDKGNFEAAAGYYRLGACLGDKNENFARSFYLAERHLRRADAAIGFLRERNERLGRKSSAPTVTLVQSLHQTGQTAEALRLLDEALSRRPDDGALCLFATDFHGRFSHFALAEKLLAEAREHCAPAAWHRAAATLADYQSQRPAALVNWREVLALEPLAHDAIQAITRLLAETEGRQPAGAFLDEISPRFPFSCPLLRFRIEWLREDGVEAGIPHIRRLLEVNSADAWGWRELALAVARTGKTLEAFDAANEAVRLEPNRSQGYCVRARVYELNRQIAEAREDLRAAVRIEVDNKYALSQFIAIAPTLAERKEALAIVAEELRRQVIFNEALSAYQEAAHGVLPAEEVLSLLQDAHKARPNLWQAWSVLINQLIEMGRYPEALELARDATRNFPLIARLFVDLARVEQARLETAGEISALEQALELSPAYAYASRQLADIHGRRHEWAKAKKVLEDALVANPLDATNQGSLAYVLWQSGDRDAAIERVRNAIRMEPGYDWGWRSLIEWGRASGKPELAVEMGRDLARTRAGEARSWLLLAKCLTPETGPGKPVIPEPVLAEIFSALDRAVELNPVCEDAYDWRARLLTHGNRFDEALAQCSPVAFQPVPARLQIRAAWVNVQRGNVAQGIIQANAALAGHPDYYHGWQLLSDWYLQTKQADKAVEAAEKMALLAPLNAVPLGYLGELKLKLGDAAGAKSAFQRAFSLDPNYEYAGFQLLERQLADKEIRAAAETLTLLERKGATHQTLTFAVALELARKQWNLALKAFESLCESGDAERWSLNKAIKGLDAAGRGRSVNSVLEKYLATKNCSPALAECWVERSIARGRWNLHARLKKLVLQGETGRRAVLCYLDQIGSAYSAAKRKRDVIAPLKLRFHFGRLLRRHRQWLEKDEFGWGKVGYVLACAERAGPAIAWLSDWKSRPNVESWMLYNLVLMLHRKRRYAEAREIIRYAVSLRHWENLFGLFRLFAAFEEALEGNRDLARQHLATLPDGAVEEANQPLLAMTRIQVDLLEEKPEGGSRFKEVRNGLKTAFGKTRPFECALPVRDGYARFLKAAAPRAGGIPLRIWGCWYYRQTAWFYLLFLLPLIPVLAYFPLGIIPAVFLAKILVSKRH